MAIPVVVFMLAAMAVFWLAYWTYGRWVSRVIETDPNKVTPAVRLKDNHDFVPTRKAVLMGSHFAGIAGAAPIVGPIVAGAAFGWLPALLWILIANPLIGAVHDYVSTMSSVRHDGKTMGEVINRNIGMRSSRYFLAFAMLLVILVVAVFGVVISVVFEASPEAASASVAMTLIAIPFGIYLYRMSGRLLYANLVFIPLVFASIFAGNAFPIQMTKEVWLPVVLLYCWAASILPVWSLLQPRGYLSSYLLYAGLGLGFVGLMVGGLFLGAGDYVTLPAFTNFNGNGFGPLFPLLFITIACGAVSGGHCLIACGTTSKQLSSEGHGQMIGYGGMLLEGLVGVLALSTIAVVGVTGGVADGLAFALPNFATGGAIFLSHVGIPTVVGTTLMALLLSTFLLTTMDSITRLGRYIFGEFIPKPSDQSGAVGKVARTSLRHPLGASAVVVIAAFGLSFGAWSALWPLFGSANQLLAGLALLGATAWLARWASNKYALLATAIPAAFIFAVTISGFVFLTYRNLTGEVVGVAEIIQSVIAMGLIALAVLMGIETIRAVRETRNARISRPLPMVSAGASGARPSPLMTRLK